MGASGRSSRAPVGKTLVGARSMVDAAGGWCGIREPPLTGRPASANAGGRVAWAALGARLPGQACYVMFCYWLGECLGLCIEASSTWQHQRKGELCVGVLRAPHYLYPPGSWALPLSSYLYPPTSMLGRAYVHARTFLASMVQLCGRADARVADVLRGVVQPQPLAS